MKKRIWVILYIFSLVTLITAAVLLTCVFGKRKDVQGEIVSKLVQTEQRIEEVYLQETQASGQLEAAEYIGERETDKVGRPEKEAEQILSDDESLAAAQDETESRLYKLQQDGSQWSVCLQKLENGSGFIVNDRRMQAASLIKLFIMGCVYEDYETMILKDTKEQIDEWLKAMITVSDNDAANQLVYVLGSGDGAAGRRKVNAFADTHGYQNTHMGRLLLAPNDADDNYTSAADCVKFLHDCYKKKLVHSEEMLDLLEQQTKRSKIPAGIPKDITVRNKTGELQDVQNDAAIIYAADSPYILCVISQELQNGENAVAEIVSLSESLYGYLTEQ